MSLGERIQHAWNAFFSKEVEDYRQPYAEATYYYRPDRPRLSRGHERSLVTAVYNRIAIDCAAINIQHVRVDEDGRYLETIRSPLNNALTLEANLDQTGRALVQDIVMSLLDEGCVAIVPTDTSTNPFRSGSYDIHTLRVGKIINWAPSTVQVRLYNERTGTQKDLWLPKRLVAIVENPLYSVMNEPNSTLQRLIRKLNLLDAIDEQSGAGKLDLIIQLPYVIKTEARKKQAIERRKEIEDQLAGSKYGIAYTDGTEKIQQLNRPIENNLLSQIEYLTNMLYSQLGMTQEVISGTANEEVMLNYYNRTVEPILSAITEEMKRKFLTKTARTQGQSIYFYRDPFRLVTITKLADIADRLTRNEIASSNEMRSIMGWKPSDNPRANELVNKNISQNGSNLPQPSSGEIENQEEVEEPIPFQEE